MQVNDFSIVPAVQGKWRGSDFWIFTLSGILCYVSQGNKLGFDYQCVPTGLGLYQGTEKRGVVSPSMPRRWGRGYI